MKKTVFYKLSVVFVIVCVLSIASVAVTFAKGSQMLNATTCDENSSTWLQTTLNTAQPGDVISLEDCIYLGRFKITVSGTASQPITLLGSRNAILDGEGKGYTLQLDGANYWHLVGFTIRNGKKGIMIDQSNYNVIDNILVSNTVQEGIHLRIFSSNNLIQNSVIRDTGKGLGTPTGDPTDAGYAEGIYIGSAVTHWATTTGGTPDASNFNRVLNNHIGPDVLAEAVDVKEGTQGGEITGNCFDHAGLSGTNSADSWVDMKGNSYQINNNIGVQALEDGFQSHIAVAGWGNNNTFHLNQAYVYNASGLGISIEDQRTGYGTALGNIVYTDNVAIGATAISNIGLTAGSLPGTPMPTPDCPTPTQPFVPTASATHTSTSTATRTLTPTPTLTPSVTRTLTTTSTLPPTLTVTQTITLTPSATRTLTPTASQTLTPSATHTLVTSTVPPTLTATQTVTLTPSVTRTSTAIVTATPTKTFTLTPTRTRTKTRTPAIVTTTFTSSAVQDGWVLESTETSGIGGTLDSAGTTFRLGDDAADKQYRGLLHFDTSSLPDGAIITSVVLKIKQLSGTSGDNPFNTHGALQVDMRALYFGADENLAVNDFQFAAGAANVASFGATPISGTWYSATLNATGRNQISKTAATQFRLRFALDDNDNMNADYFTFYTGNRSSVSDRPQLVITYSLP